MNHIGVALIVGIAFVVAAFLVGGRYTLSVTQHKEVGVVFVVDRFTGEVTICSWEACFKPPTLSDLSF
jgi:hypothetical protein